MTFKTSFCGTFKSLGVILEYLRHTVAMQILEYIYIYIYILIGRFLFVILVVLENNLFFGYSFRAISIILEVLRLF